MDKRLRDRTAELVNKAAVRLVSPFLPAEQQTAITGLPEFLVWIRNVEKELGTYPDQTPEILASQNWLQLARDLATLSDLAEDVRKNKRPAADFSRALYIEGALQRVIFSALRGYLASHLGILESASALQKLTAAQERLAEIIEKQADAGKKKPRATVTHEVTLRVRSTMDLAIRFLPKSE